MNTYYMIDTRIPDEDAQEITELPIPEGYELLQVLAYEPSGYGHIYLQAVLKKQIINGVNT